MKLTMYGKGILKGLGVTLESILETYLDDISWWVRGKKRYNSAEGIAHPLRRMRAASSRCNTLKSNCSSLRNFAMCPSLCT
jgi:hypothetical protein